jgi:hypothetical protein
VKVTRAQVDRLSRGISLGEHSEQEQAVRAALHRLLVEGARGVVLADEVGFGKTYEALAIASHLCAHAGRRHKKFRVLVLCKNALVRKWEDETSIGREGHGFPRYLDKTAHPAWQALFAHTRVIDRRKTATALRNEGVRAKRTRKGLQVPPGLYVVNERLLLPDKRREYPLLRQIYRTRWNVVIVDEAHHYARDTRPVELFAGADRDLRNYAHRGLHFDRILALTATPFSLETRELVSLLALIRADEGDLQDIERGLKRFEAELGNFFELRERAPSDPLRAQKVATLQQLRTVDALETGAKNRGLESLLRRYLIRNTKHQHERRHALIERANGAFTNKEFGKLKQDLKQLVHQSPLIPFEGEHALFYLQLRDVLQDVADRAHEDGETRGTFISTDLRQGLSSYPQILSSALLGRKLESASRLRKLVSAWVRRDRQHPKVASLAQVIDDIVRDEIEKVRSKPDAWLSKIVVFNKLIEGTAPHLVKVLSGVLGLRFGRYLDELLDAASVRRETLVSDVRKAVDDQLRSEPAFATRIPEEFDDKALASHRGKSLARVFLKPLQDRASQPLALIDLLRSVSSLDGTGIEQWIREHITGPVVRTANEVARLVKAGQGDATDNERVFEIERAQRDLIATIEESRSVHVVGRFDGKNERDREAHRLNFNRQYNPFVLLVSGVGEEGIDLQQQCRYVLHYDLEWNPARMEQREGRVDRMGWGRADEGFIDVRFFLLKGTYEERIFHTVMQREQWFQVLIGSKRKELGELPEDADKEVAQDDVEDCESFGALTEAEKKAVMLDLRP